MDTIICKEKTEFELSQTVYCPAAMTHPLTAGAASPGSSMTAFVFGKFPANYWVDLQQVKFSADTKTRQRLIIRYLQKNKGVMIYQSNQKKTLWWFLHFWGSWWSCHSWHPGVFFFLLCCLLVTWPLKKNPEGLSRICGIFWAVKSLTRRQTGRNLTLTKMERQIIIFVCRFNSSLSTVSFWKFASWRIKPLPYWQIGH